MWPWMDVVRRGCMRAWLPILGLSWTVVAAVVVVAVEAEGGCTG